jgi:predicted XRE-type DNA-binding protein
MKYILLVLLIVSGSVKGQQTEPVKFYYSDSISNNYKMIAIYNSVSDTWVISDTMKTIRELYDIIQFHLKKEQWYNAQIEIWFQINTPGNHDLLLKKLESLQIGEPFYLY